MTVVGDLLSEFKERPAPGEDLPVLTLTERNGFVHQADRFKKRLATEDTSAYKVVRFNDLAFNPYLLWAGAVAQNTVIAAGVISPLYPTFRVRDGYDPRYVAKMLLSPEMISAYDTIAFGSVPRRRRSSVGDFLALPVAEVPPLAEQRRIAAILDRAASLIRKRHRAANLTADLEQAVFDDMFGTHRMTVPFDSTVDEFRYGTSNKSGPSGHPVLRIPNIAGQRLNLEDLKTVEVSDSELRRLRLLEGDLLFVRSNGNPDNVGRSAVFDASKARTAGADRDEWVFASYLIRARLSSSHVPVFVSTFLSGPAGRKQLRERSKTSAGQYNVNIEGLKSVQLPDVPLGQQKAFEALAQTIRSRHEGMTIGGFDELFTSLQSRAFRGEL